MTLWRIAEVVAKLVFLDKMKKITEKTVLHMWYEQGATWDRHVEQKEQCLDSVPLSSAERTFFLDVSWEICGCYLVH